MKIKFKKLMRSYSFLVSILLFFSFLSDSYSQGAIEKKYRLSDKVFFGGGIGLQFGSYTGVDISPMIGYRVFPNFQTGLKLTYQYYGGSDIEWRQNVLGGSVFAQYILFDRIIAHGEYEVLNVRTDWDNRQYETQRRSYYSPLLGGGVYQKLGDRAAVMLLVLFDVSGSSNSPYQNPIVKLSIIL